MASVTIPVKIVLNTSATLEIPDKDLETLKNGEVPASLAKAIEGAGEIFEEFIADLDDFTNGKVTLTIDSLEDHEIEFDEDSIEEE